MTNQPENKPAFLDLRSQSSASVSTTSSRPLRSPRLHVAGDVPPSMSPLDAFAAHSRMLAKQLEESESRTGRRMSRLPPLTVESPLIVQGRSEYFRSLSYDSSSEQESVSPQQQQQPQQGTGLGLTTEVETPLERPVSMHPRMSQVPPTPDQSIPVPPNPFAEAARGRKLDLPEEDAGFYGARREQSPVDLESLTERQRILRTGFSLSDRALSEVAFDQFGGFRAPPPAIFQLLEASESGGDANYGYAIPASVFR
ncbi:hypothetical protein DL770_002229 [Monosporascus sp. CRB-9-2]|nr:hypothetical protein DL770_002229 [Monosporascus sp. CRB-9-2]